MLLKIYRKCSKEDRIALKSNHAVTLLGFTKLQPKMFQYFELESSLGIPHVLNVETFRKNLLCFALPAFVKGIQFYLRKLTHFEVTNMNFWKYVPIPNWRCETQDGRSRKLRRGAEGRSVPLVLTFQQVNRNIPRRANRISQEINF